ncbi:MAG: DUF86 domain-containing protein [Deltaproteobacteria bacterium]|nr:DUF86 domain-containing protein [Deltaproteobacteria bacterium]
MVLMDLQQAIQACIDLAVHVCADDQLGVVEGPAAAFALLASSGYIPDELAVELAGAAGLRNLIVHRYGDLRSQVIVAGLEAGLRDLEAFAGALWRQRDAG